MGAATVAVAAAAEAEAVAAGAATTAGATEEAWERLRRDCCYFFVCWFESIVLFVRKQVRQRSFGKQGKGRWPRGVCPWKRLVRFLNAPTALSFFVECREHLLLSPIHTVLSPLFPFLPSTVPSSSPRRRCRRGRAGKACSPAPPGARARAVFQRRRRSMFL